MTKSKSLIERQLEKKRNPALVNTIILLKKNKDWLKVAGMLTGSKRKRLQVNLDEIDDVVKEGERIVLPGKVLSRGKITKKIKLISCGFSEKAKEKLLNSSCEVSYISDEVKSNPSAEGLRILSKGDFKKWK